MLSLAAWLSLYEHKSPPSIMAGFYVRMCLSDDLLQLIQCDRRIQAALHRLPVGVCALLIVKAHHVDFFELTPFYTPSVEVGNPVCRQVCYFYAYLVAARLQLVLAVQHERNRPCAANKAVVDIHSGALTHVAEVDCPIALGLVLGQVDVGCISTGAHRNLH